MKIYLSSISMLQKFFLSGFFNPAECYILCSFYGISDFEKTYLSSFKNVMIDSGAFSFIHGKGKDITNWDDYIENYARFINENNISLFFELDIDNLVGYDEVIRLRDKLENLTNKKSIPVWHPSRGVHNFLEMCDKYSYVAIGSAKIHGISRRIQEKSFPWFISKAHEKGVKIHGLGYTSVEGLHKYKFDSVDSTTWLVGAKYGNVVKIQETKDGGFSSYQTKPQNMKVISTLELSKINFETFLNFSKYADQHL